LALQKTKGNRKEAATLIGINVRTLRNKLKEYGQEPADADEDSGD
jgi:DNA-binding protein Fis